MSTVFSCCTTITCHTAIPPGASADCFVETLEVICPPELTGIVGTAYSQSVTISGGSAPFTYAVGAGALPPGLGPINSSTGAITGTPTVAGAFAVMFEVTDTDGTVGRVDCAFTIAAAAGGLGGYLLQEDGSYLLQEDGSRILLDPVATTPSIGGVS